MTDRYVIEIPWRIPLLNEFLSMHWSKRMNYSKQVAAEIAVAIPKHKRPLKPWDKWSILVERESTKAPDPGAIWGGAKPIPDVLQPVSKKHPRGLGIVREDSPDSLIAYAELHVQGPQVD